MRFSQLAVDNFTFNTGVTSNLNSIGRTEHNFFKQNQVLPRKNNLQNNQLGANK